VRGRKSGQPKFVLKVEFDPWKAAYKGCWGVILKGGIWEPQCKRAAKGLKRGECMGEKHAIVRWEENNTTYERQNFQRTLRGYQRKGSQKKNTFCRSKNVCPTFESVIPFGRNRTRVCGRKDAPATWSGESCTFCSNGEKTKRKRSVSPKENVSERSNRKYEVRLKKGDKKFLQAKELSRYQRRSQP